MNPEQTPVTEDQPIMKVTVYLKSGAVVTFPGRMIEKYGRKGFMTLVPLEIPFMDLEAVALVLQEPWTEEL